MTALVEEISELKESAAEEGADLGADEVCDGREHNFFVCLFHS